MMFLSCSHDCRKSPTSESRKFPTQAQAGETILPHLGDEPFDNLQSYQMVVWHLNRVQAMGTNRVPRVALPGVRVGSHNLQ